MQHWIFVSHPFSSLTKSTFDEMVRNSKRPLRWFIGKHTNNRKKLAEGDKVLFYQAGQKGKEMVGSGELISSLQCDEKGQLFVLIGKLNHWRKPVAMERLVDHLMFIKNKKRWGSHLEGGVIKIPEKDFETILKSQAKWSLSVT